MDGGFILAHTSLPAGGGVMMNEYNEETFKQEPDYLYDESCDVTIEELNMDQLIKSEIDEDEELPKPVQAKRFKTTHTPDVPSATKKIEVHDVIHTIKSERNEAEESPEPDQDSIEGHVLSLSQLSELWHYDMLMASILLSLPLRKCSASPQDDPNFPAMDRDAFRSLKSQIGKMWITASHLFTSRRTDDHGWGLFISEDFDKNERILTAGKAIPLGWVARAPGPNDATHHRYLRSRYIRGKDSSLYLGGPISLANYGAADMVICELSTSKEKHLANTMLVSRAPKRKFTAGDEVLWTCNMSQKEMQTRQFGYEKEWKLRCCSDSDRLHVKPQKIRRFQPQKKSVGVKCFRPCTFCGKNLAETAKPGSKINIKCHLALKHSLELSNELPGDDHKENGVSPKLFIQHLDHLVNVYNTLNNMNYKIVPACKFFELTGTSPLLPDSSKDEKDLIFQAFEEEGRQAFRKYQVLYLKGISKPTKYEDLLVPTDTSYSNVKWYGNQPSNINFSLSQYTLTGNEQEAHALEIKSSVMKAVVEWMNV